MNYSQGSLWHKWDLHVHTPCSIIQHYGGNNDESWDNFIEDLESLPPEFKVIGINDYIFLDGYKRILEYKNGGRLQNIDLFLPVIELRLGMFVGTDENWHRLNFHVIFSDKITDDTCFTIESQFLSDITGAYNLSPELNHLRWSAKPTMKSLIELGKMIKSSVPEGELHRYKSDLEEGFNALNFDYQKIIDKLRLNHYFIGRHFTALGKTEWDELKWKKNSIGTKKSVVNEVDFVFTAAESVSKWKNAKQSLVDNSVNSRLLDCSDAHYLSSSTNKDRIGNCFTWIKADTTFEGLRQILYEDERIFIGEIPAKKKEVNLNPNRFIKSISINRKSDSTLSEKWFSSQLELNPSMIAIIGNKGAGKSALIDIIGLLGNSHVDADSRPFLTRKKFGVKDKWSHFHSVLRWHSGVEIPKSLDGDIDELRDEFVRYIPQNFFEDICNELQDNNEKGLFTEELYKVIYSHIPQNDRLGEAALQGLIDQKTRAVNDAIENYRSELRKKNNVIIELQTKISPERIANLGTKIADKESTLLAVKQNHPKEVQRPEAVDDTKVVLNQLETIGQDKEEKKKQLSVINKALSNLKVQESDITNFRQRINSFNEQYLGLIDDLAEQYAELIAANDLDLRKLISVDISLKDIELIEKNISEGIVRKEKEGVDIQEEIMKIETQEFLLRESLAEEEKKYHQYIASMEEWNERIAEIIGDEDTPDSLLYLQQELKKIQYVLPDQLNKEKKERLEIVEKIIDKKCQLVNEHQSLYKPVHEFIEQQGLEDDLELRFSVSIIIRNFEDSFFSFINRGVAGTYYGIDDSEKFLRKLIDKYNFNRKEDILSFLDEIVQSLEKDMRAGQKQTNRNIKHQLKQERTIDEFYNFLFSMNYLVPEYVPKLGEKELYQLSPGEKGTLLLVFYLLVDKEKIPLLIDQPEHNLDNETIYELLVDSVKIAKKNRQLIVVTHNPNLAVVCDAEQVIYASRDGKDGNKIDYKSGAIECKEINKKIIDVLEGTIPAFNKRRFKYLLNLDEDKQDAQNH